MNRECDLFFENLNLYNYKDLIKYAYRLTYMRNFAEEIVQEAFTEAYRKIDILHKHENPVEWFYVAVKNISKSYLREIIEMKNRLPSEIYESAVTDGESDMTYLLSCLTRDETNMILRFYIYGLSLSEISKEYDISLSACKMRL